MDLFITCKPGYETTLTRELALYNIAAQTRGNGWIRAQLNRKKQTKRQTPLSDACFAHLTLEDPVQIRETSANAFTAKFVELFMASIKHTCINNPWQFLFTSADNKQLIHRAKTVENYWFNTISKKMSRVAKLARKGIPYCATFTQGFFVYFVDFNLAFVSYKALSAGQQRMKMDPQSPSRSYLKIEEAYGIIGCKPEKNETVIDLGAAPGGWSYSALKRGARVTAIDNGRLKEPVNSHPQIKHLKEDALKFTPAQETIPVDWLLCDIIEKPEIILNLTRKWLRQRWCRHFIVNLKIGRSDPILLLKEIKDPGGGLSPYCCLLKIRQLYHNREEITVAGKQI